MKSTTQIIRWVARSLSIIIFHAFSFLGNQSIFAVVGCVTNEENG